MGNEAAVVSVTKLPRLVTESPWQATGEPGYDKCSMVGSEGPTKKEEKSMAFVGTGLVGPIVIIVLYAVGILIAYSIVKAAVRNGTIEAYIRLRREKLYPPE